MKKLFFFSTFVWKVVDLEFWLDVFLFDGEILFLFIYETLIYYLENDLESSLIFVFFLF